MKAVFISSLTLFAVITSFGAGLAYERPPVTYVKRVEVIKEVPKEIMREVPIYQPFKRDRHFVEQTDLIAAAIPVSLLKPMRHK